MNGAVPSTAAPRARRRPKLRWIASALAFAVGAPALLLAWKSYRLERTLCFPERRPTRADPAQLGLSGARVVSISGAELQLKGWYLPSTTRAAALLIHGAGGNRASLAVEGAALGRAGIGALLLELPGHGESDGQISWGEAERAAIRAALGWLAVQPENDPERLGGFGFSLGGYVLAQVAAEMPRLRALALAGTPSNLVDRLRLTHRRFGFIGLWPAELAFERSGTDPALLPALGAVQKLAPRPLLIITGDRDALVPPSMAQALYDSAGQPKRIEVIRGAGHGGYAEAAPETYEARLVEFFRTALAPKAAEATQ